MTSSLHPCARHDVSTPSDVAASRRCDVPLTCVVSRHRLSSPSVDYAVTLCLAAVLAVKYIFFDGSGELDAALQAPELSPPVAAIETADGEQPITQSETKMSSRCTPSPPPQRCVVMAPPPPRVAAVATLDTVAEERHTGKCRAVVDGRTDDC